MGIESVMETITGLALFASSFALLGFVIGEIHGRKPKQKRDARGRFISKPKYFWTGTNVERHLPPPSWLAAELSKNAVKRDFYAPIEWTRGTGKIYEYTEEKRNSIDENL